MSRTTYTDEQKHTALAAYAEHGPAEAERLTGIPRKTIASWARRTGTQMDASAPQRLRFAAEIAALTVEKKRARIAEIMLDRLAESLDRLSDDAQANAAESRLIGVLTEKQALLSGGATSRIEMPADADRGARLAAVHQLKEQAAKRAQGEEQTG
jgi:hypothetical protein